MSEIEIPLDPVLAALLRAVDLIDAEMQRMMPDVLLAMRAAWAVPVPMTHRQFMARYQRQQVRRRRRVRQHR